MPIGDSTHKVGELSMLRMNSKGLQCVIVFENSQLNQMDVFAQIDVLIHAPNRECPPECLRRLHPAPADARAIPAAVLRRHLGVPI